MVTARRPHAGRETTLHEAPWKINLFGRLTAERGDHKITRFRTEKTALLLATLARDPHRAQRRDELAERLWPDQPTESGRNALRVALTALRHFLEPEPEDRGTVLIADRHDVRLDPDHFTTDTAEFEASLLRAARAGNDPDRIRWLEAAVKQYQADFLTEFEDLWITAERQRLAEAYQLALRRLVRLQVNGRRYDRALGIARKAVQADPYLEENHRLLMQIYALMGRPGAALRQYQEFERLLQDQAGSAPSPATQDMRTQLCPSGDTSAPRHVIRPRRTALLPAEPESGTNRRPALRLPALLTRLVGREDAILQVLEMLDTPEVRLVNLTGPAGVGKTRLALAAAEQIRSQGRPVCFLSLVGLQDPAEIVTHLAAAFHLPLRPRADLWQRIVDALSDDAALLVLDNLEHLLPDAASVVRELLEAVPSLIALTTSRQRLGVPGEYGYAVAPLPLPNRGDDPAQAAACPSVSLWLDRVRAVAPEFRLTAANCHPVAALCRTLEGLPLALELAAAWAGVLSPAQIETRLTARFDLLVSREPRIAGRHASLRAALDWSFNLLALPVQRFFARLGRFRAGWTLEAAEAISGEPQTLEYLAQLQERSLITTEQTETGPRYNFLETIREFALSNLCEQDLEDADARFCDYFLQVSREAEEPLKGPESALFMRRLQADEENLRTALTLGLRDAARPERPLRMAQALYRFWYISGAVSEGRRWLRSALDFAPPDAAERPRALTALGNLAYGEGDLETAERYYKECREIYAAAGDKRGAAVTLGNLANLKQRIGDFEEARALTLQSLQLFKELEDARGQALALGNLALACRGANDMEAALAFGEQSIAQFRLIGDQQNLMTGLANTSTSALSLGRQERCAALLRESLDLCLKLSARRSLALILTCTADLCLSRKDYEAAIQLLAAAGAMFNRLESTFSPRTRQAQAREIDALRELLGDTVVQREWEHGLQLDETAAAALVMSCLRSNASASTMNP